MKYKTIKISEKAYKEIMMLSKRIEKENMIPEIGKVNIGTTINFALDRAKEKLNEKERRNRFLSSAGGWSDIDTKKLIKDIYESRRRGTRWEMSLN